jgi:hypothetical protein
MRAPLLLALLAPLPADASVAAAAPPAQTGPPLPPPLLPLLELHVGSCRRCSHTSIHDARDAVRRFRQEQQAQQAQQAQQQPRVAATAVGEVRVVVHEGTYPPLQLDADLDSGTAVSPTVFVGHNRDGETAPVISAGVAVPRAAWKPAATGRGVLTADLTQLGVTAADLGRLPPNGNARGEADWITPKGSQWWGTLCEQRNASFAKAMLFHESALDTIVGTHLARFPNVDPATGHWQFLHGVGPVAALGPNGRPSSHVIGLEVNANDSARVLGWVKTEEAPFLHGYWVADWEDAVVALNSTNASANAVLWSAGADGPQPKRNPRFFGLNLLSEIDAPNEYFISRAGVVSFLPARPMAEWRESPVLSVNHTAVSIDGVSHVVLRGLTVVRKRRTTFVLFPQEKLSNFQSSHDRPQSCDE